MCGYVRCALIPVCVNMGACAVQLSLMQLSWVELGVVAHDSQPCLRAPLLRLASNKHNVHKLIQTKVCSQL